MNRLLNKTAVVTGAASGIGKAIAMRFAMEGAKVIVNDVSEDGQHVTEEICAGGGTAVFKQADVRSECEVRELMTFVSARFGGLHLLVNNAGITSNETVVTASEEDWQEVMDINLKGAWHCCKYAIPLMMETGGGSIVNISSTHSIRTQPRHFPYHASKAGIMAMTN